MLRKTVFIFTIVVVLLSLSPSGASAAAGPLPPSPDALLDCGIWAYNPVRSGSNVNGKGEISCASNHPMLKVVAGLGNNDANPNRPHYTSKVKICYNTNYCSVTASLPYVSGLCWSTDVSGYQGTDWQAWIISDRVCL